MITDHSRDIRTGDRYRYPSMKNPLTGVYNHGIRIFLLILFGLCSLTARAEPNVIGTFSGTLSGNSGACIGPPSPSSNSVTMTITSQSGSSFSGTFTTSGLNSGGTVSGTIDTLGNMSGTFGGAGIIGIGFSGVFNGSTLSIGPLNWQVEDLAMNCFDLGGTLNYSGGEIIDPTIAPGTELENAAKILGDILTIEQPVHKRLRKLQFQKILGPQQPGGPKVSRFDETGFDMEASGGLNAGDHQFGNLGVWLSYNYTATENDFFRTASDSDRHTVVGGIDLSADDRFVYGLAFAYENSDTDTAFNRGNLQTDGFTLAPYAGVLLSDLLSIDASFGYSWIENDQFRTDPATGAIIRSDPDGERIFFSGNFNGITYIDNWILSGRAGVLFARSTTDRFFESNGVLVAERKTKLGELRLGGEAAYSYREFEPFVSMMYEYDFSFDRVTLTPGPQPANDNNDVYFSTGVRYFGNQGLSANLEYSKRLFREDFDEDSFTLTVRYDF